MKAEREVGMRAEALRSLRLEAADALYGLDDYADAVRIAARLAARCLPEYCVIEAIDAVGRATVAAAAASVTNLHLAARLEADWQRGPTLSHTARAVRGAAIVQDLAPRRRTGKALGGISARIAGALSPTSLIRVPFLEGGSSAGAASFLACGAGRYSQTDLTFATEVTSYIGRYLRAAQLIVEGRRGVNASNELTESIAHDLRNSLHVVRLVSSSLHASTRRRDHHRVDKHLSILRRSIEGMARLVGDLRDRAEQKLGRFGIVITGAVSPVRLLEDAVELAIGVDEHRRIVIEVPSLPIAPIAVDEQRVLQVLANLIENALKFGPVGGPITVGAERLPRTVRFFVRDGGPGMSAEQQTHAFERGWQANSGDHRGSGLGLAICKEIVEGHGGEIGVTSRRGEGCTFHFTLPAVHSKGGQSRPHLVRQGAENSRV